MLFINYKKSISIIAILLLLISGIAAGQNEINDLKFAQSSVSDSDTIRTLRSMVKVRDISETYSTGGLYLLTHYGNREELFQKENQEAIDNPLINQCWRFCSIFSITSDNSVTIGRNWDNQNVGSIIVNLYHPPGGYASISFSRAIDLGFPLNVDLEEFKDSDLGNRLLLAPFYTYDGINEHGLSIAVAGVRPTTVKPKNDRRSLFITFLIRKVLDQTKNIEEAVNLVENYVPFDLNENSLNCHLLIADSIGSSVILEYTEEKWRKIYSDKSWQVLTNKPIYNVLDADLREKCWRYYSMSETLENTKGNLDWKSAMDILYDVEQKGTTWSVVYCPRTKELYFTVYQNHNDIYHLEMP